MLYRSYFFVLVKQIISISSTYLSNFSAEATILVKKAFKPLKKSLRYGLKKQTFYAISIINQPYLSRKIITEFTKMSYPQFSCKKTRNIIFYAECKNAGIANVINNLKLSDHKIMSQNFVVKLTTLPKKVVGI